MQFDMLSWKSFILHCSVQPVGGNKLAGQRTSRREKNEQQNNQNAIEKTMNRYRIAWIAAIVLIFLISLFVMKPILNACSPYPKDLFGYFGTVATIMGLIIAIFEVLHAVDTSVRTEKIVRTKIDEYEFGDKMWTNSSCIEVIEKMVDAISDSKFTDAKHMLRDLRKRLNRVSPDLLKREFKHIDEKTISLEQLEQHLYAYEKSTAKAPVSKPQIRGINRALLELRALLEPQQTTKINKGA